MSPYRYEAEEVLDGVVEISTHYCGEWRRTGRRKTYRCPSCNKRKYEVLVEGEQRRAGCFNAACVVPDSTDAIGIVAHFEDLDRSTQFVEILKRGYDILGLQPHTPDREAKSRPGTEPEEKWSANGKSSSWVSSATGAPNTAPHIPEERESDERDAGLVHLVYARLMELCPLVETHSEYLRARGLSDQTIVRGRFGSISKTRVRHVEAQLAEAFGEELLRVPGFYRTEADDLLFSLREEYVLIPYHDGQGRITTLEGRATKKKAHRSVLDGGNHLYVFPDFVPDDLEGFCEGPMGAVVAAQHGIPVGSIQGVKRYRTAGQNAPLPEFSGVDFRGRALTYIPDLDVKPQAIADVEAHLPKACEYLISKQGGRPLVARLPRGKDLDDYLLSVPPAERRVAFDELVAKASSPEEDLKHKPDAGPSPATTNGAVTEAPAVQPEVKPATELGTVGGTRTGSNPDELNISQHKDEAARAPKKLDGGGDQARREGDHKGNGEADKGTHDGANEGAKDGTPGEQIGRAIEEAGHDELAGEHPAGEEAEEPSEPLEGTAQPKEWWGFPKRRPTLDYTPADEDAPANHLKPREVLAVFGAGVGTLLAATVLPRILLLNPAGAQPGAEPDTLALLSVSGPEKEADGLLAALAPLLDIAAVLTHNALFPPAGALLFATLVALHIKARRQALRNIREGRA